MKNIVLIASLICAVIVSTVFVHAQTGVSAAQSVSGKWSGSFDITQPDGTQQHDTAWLDLKQDGLALIGTAGPNQGKQSEIKDGKVNGADIQFTVAGPGGPLLVTMHLDGDYLKGEGTVNLPAGKLRAKIYVTRVTEKSSSTPSSSLYEEIAHMDSVLFDAFNNRDFDTLKTLFTPDLEFYHDRAGLTSYEQNMESFERHFASSTKVRRELVSGSLEVYPIPNYGAVEVGIHRFYSTEPGGKEELTATAKFVHVWQYKNGQWKISRVVSFDHQ
jgi:ketosteroid isomerase-like protein